MLTLIPIWTSVRISHRAGRKSRLHNLLSNYGVIALFMGRIG